MRARSATRVTFEKVSGAHPALLLGVLALVQLGVVAWLAFGTPHNGWIWYSGGDATEYWTAQWSVAHGWIPQSAIGWGVPVLYAWVPLVAGTTLLAGLPVIVLFQVFVLMPLALVLVWALADRLYGRSYAWATAALWVVAPVVVARSFVPRYRPRLEESVLAPHWAGLTDMADFPSLVTIVAAAWATTRAVQNGRFTAAVGAGALGGIAIGLKPGNGYFVLAVLVLVVAYTRSRVALGWAAGVAPALATLTVWKLRGLGNIPILNAYAGRREASGAVAAIAVRRYLPYDWHHLSIEWTQLREFFWDLRFLEFLLIAAALGALRRNVRAGLFLIVWAAAFLIFKGMSPQADIQTTSYWRLTLPGLAAVLLLLPALAFLLPGTRPRPWRVAEESWGRLRLAAPLTAVVVVASLLPFALMLFEHPAPRSPLRLAHYVTGTEAPITSALTPRITAAGPRVTLSWPRVSGAGAQVHYVVIRTEGDDGCSTLPKGAGRCFISAPVLTSTAATTATDTPGHGRHFYRIAAVADNRASPDGVDLVLVGPAVSVRV